MNITKAIYMHDYVIEVTFDDGIIRVIDLENLFRIDGFQYFKNFVPLKKFKQFHIEDGVLCWGDNECDINPWNIYEGKYDVKKKYNYSENQSDVAAEPIFEYKTKK